MSELTLITDDANALRNFPYNAVLTLQFGANLVADADAIFRVFFTNDDYGDNNGYDYGTVDAILVNKSLSVGTVSREKSGGTAIIETDAPHGLLVGDVNTILPELSIIIGLP